VAHLALHRYAHTPALTPTEPRSNVRTHPSTPFRAAALLVLALTLAPGCKSTQEWRSEVDEETYELVQSRRQKLALDTGTFSIEPNPDSLREKLLRGEARIDAPLSLVRCLEIAAENSRDFQSRKERLFLAALDLTLERWRFAIQKGGTLNAAVDGTGDEAENASTDGRFSLSRLLGTGATVAGSIGLNLARSLITSDGWSPTSDVSFSVTQPLLAGFGERIVKEPLTQAERDLVYEVRTFERFRRTFAFDVASRYYRIVQLEDEVRNQENNVKNLEQLSERNRALAEAGRLSDIEVGQARQNELRSRNQLLSQRQRLDDARDQFKLFMGLPISADLPLDPGAMADIEAQKDATVDFAEDLVIAIALKERLDHQTELDRVDDASRRVEVAEDALQGVLTLKGDVNLSSRSGQPLNYDLRDAGWSVEAEWSLPFERLPQRNSYRRALVSRDEAQRSRLESEDQIRSSLRSDLRTAANRRDSYTIQAKAVELAQQRIESTRLKLDAGRADTRDLLEAQESLLEAQNALTSALIDYTLERLNLFLDMELLRFEPTGIRLDEARLEQVRLERERLERAEIQAFPVEPADDRSALRGTEHSPDPAAPDSTPRTQPGS